jgi:hypothetical protein
MLCILSAFFAARGAATKNPAAPRAIMSLTSAASGLTMRQCGGVVCVNSEHARHLHDFKTTARIAAAAVRVR